MPEQHNGTNLLCRLPAITDTVIVISKLLAANPKLLLLLCSATLGLILVVGAGTFNFALQQFTSRFMDTQLISAGEVVANK